MAYLDVGLNFRFNFRFKKRARTPKWRLFWTFRNICDRFIYTLDMCTFDVDDVTDDVTAWRQSRMDTGDGYIFSLLIKKPVHTILLVFKPVRHQYNLQYFSYHYHHYNEHHISKFWQVRNLRLPFHYLPKFSILASMFVWRFACVFVSVRNFFDTGHSFWYIFTKLDPSMYLSHVTMPIVFLGQRSNN